jgi:2-oxoglutarate ferredoxin oxidoreductase subunit gamma
VTRAGKSGAAEIVMAGFGGQGVMFMGTLLAYAGMLEGREVTFWPSYGPEMRGGTANCVVVVSNEPVASPVASRPGIGIVLNNPSFDRFEPSIQPGGLLLVNTSLVDRRSQRADLKSLLVPATEIADQLGDTRATNMVMLGALLGATGLVDMESVVTSLRRVLPERRHGLIPLNQEALRRGAESALAQAVS